MIYNRLGPVLLSLLLIAPPVVAEEGPKIGWPDFGYMTKNQDEITHLFRLKADFPEAVPSKSPAVNEILRTDFRGDDWKQYAKRVKDYIFKGNVNQEHYRNDFDVHLNEKREWYHMPWMHWGPQGREGFHGLTREGPLAPKVLHPDQHEKSHAYAVGIFNGRGGYELGQVWEGPGQAPNLSYLKESRGFPEGTVIAKLLFTPLDKRQVPWLKNPLTWNAYVVESDVPGKNDDSSKRTIADVQLLQMDIMVRDSRVNETGGWIFGTFAYNGNLNHDNKWENLVPVGLMWGNDPEVRTSQFNPTPDPRVGTKTNPRLEQTEINESDELPAMHLGWGYRLNGPADSPKSSCMSCHSTAQYPPASPIMPFLEKGIKTPPKGTKAGPKWMRWFRNLRWGETFDSELKTVNTDFSLQLSKSIKRYVEFLDKSEQGKFAAQYSVPHHPIRRNITEE